MNPELLKLVTELGGTLGASDATTLQQRLCAIDLPLPLYPCPVDTPWARAEEIEPIHGLGDFIEAHRDLLARDRTAFFEHLKAHYYAPTDALRGQVDFRCQLFTPLRAGTDDYREWGNGEDFDADKIAAITGLQRPDLLFIGFSQAYPTHYFVCLSDPHPDDPQVYSSDHTVLLDEIDVRGTLTQWLRGFMTPAQLCARVAHALERAP